MQDYFTSHVRSRMTTEEEDELLEMTTEMGLQSLFREKCLPGV
jgi:hypothetical protein